MADALVAIGVWAFAAGLTMGCVLMVQWIRGGRVMPAPRATGALLVGSVTLMAVGGLLEPTPSTAATERASTTAPVAVASPARSHPAPSQTPSITPARVTRAPATGRRTAAPSRSPALEPTSPPPSSPVDLTTPRGDDGTAVAALAALAVKGRAPKTGYRRDQFGQAWADVDGDGCDTRDDVLRRDLLEVLTTAGSGGCQVATGTLLDPHSDTVIDFTRGAGTSSQVQIDHVVALSNAWQTGAFAWAPAERVRFANDPLDLLAVQGRSNSQKGDGDAATWPPPNTLERCPYVARQIAVKAKYRLWVTAPEQAAAARILAACPYEPLPDATLVAVPAPDPAALTPIQPAPIAPDPVVPDPVAPDPVASVPVVPDPAVPDPTDPPVTAAPVEVTYPDCAAVRAAGKAPLFRGDPGYSRKLDRDGDGIACETDTAGGDGSGEAGTGGSGDGSDGDGSVSYANCAAVRAAGKAPLHSGDPGYSRKLDRDGDGIACE